MKGQGFSRIRAGMQARIPLLLFRWLMNRKVPMNHITVIQHDIGVALCLATTKPGLQDLKREYNEVFEAFVSGNGVFTALPTDSRKTSASLFSL